MSIDLSIRSTLPEKMDQPDIPVWDIKETLREIEIINEYLGGNKLTINALNKLSLPERRITIMDIGCGSGDMLRSIAKWAKSKNKDVQLTGIDWNPIMTGFAAERSQQFPNIYFKTLSVFDDELMNATVDITTCTLFCHHFEKEELVTLIRRMYALAQKAVIINDLHRSWFAYYAIKVLTTIFSKTPLIKYDAPLSVARAFKRKDLHEVMATAGINNYELRWRWAWRWELTIKK